VEACTQQRNKKRRFAAEIASALTAEAVSGTGEFQGPKRGLKRRAAGARLCAINRDLAERLFKRRFVNESDFECC